jgi:aspartate/methionine/tyrosine aminotransferase
VTLTPPRIDPFHAIGVSRLAHELKAAGRSIIHMEFGQPSTGAPQAAIEAAHRVLDRDALGYWESAPLKARIVRHYLDTYGVRLPPDDLILTCGASPALVAALVSSFSPGDQVAFARPGYVAYRNTLKALHLGPVEVACGPDQGYRLTAARLAGLDPAPAGVIIASPANPTGTITGAAELAQIARVCRERGVKIISDEIYHGLSYGEPTHSMLEFEPTALVVNSFSKYFSMAGWRLGWLVAPAAGTARACVENFFLTPPSLAQHAALAAMDCEAELKGHLDVYRRNRTLLLAALPALGLGDIAPPDGAFYIYADIGHLTDDSLAFCMDLVRDTGVAAAPGIDFDPVDGRRFIRFSFAVSTPEVEDAIGRLIPWFESRRVLVS